MKNPYPTDRRVVLMDLDADIVKRLPDGRLVPAPLTELYVHHFITGIVPGDGAEFRRKPPAYKKVPDTTDYGDSAGLEVRQIVNGADMRENVNFHFIDIRGVENWLPCIECRCRDATGRYLADGGIRCCENCTSTLESANTVDYFLQYNVTWTELNRDVLNVKTIRFDAARAIGKRIEYQVKPQKSGLHVITLKGTLQGNGGGIPNLRIGADSSNIPRTVELVMCHGHLHIGGLSLKLTRTDTNETLCELNAIYGKVLGKAGDELGFLVGIEHYLFEKPLKLRRETPVELAATYNATELHAGVMSLFNVEFLEKKYTAEDALLEGPQVAPGEGAQVGSGLMTNAVSRASMSILNFGVALTALACSLSLSW